MLRWLARVPIALLLVVCATCDASAQTGANVLVVANEASPASIRIAERYVQQRAVPADQLLRLRVATTDQISRSEFERRIQNPIADWISRHQAQDRILYLVLTKGIPLRISGVPGRGGTVASVDSELTLLYRRLTGKAALPQGAIDNPYFLGTTSIQDAARFSHAKHDIFLVTRLDGFTVDDALALIDRGAAPSAEGRVLLDQRASLSDKPNEWLADAAERLAAQGFGDRVTLEVTSRPLTKEANVLGYYSWGSNDPAWSMRHPELQFVPGAIGGLFLSTDARTLSEPPAEWKPGHGRGRSPQYAGSTQVLTGDFIRSGITGIAGHVAEPYLDRAIRPEILFPAYLAGFNLAEAFYLAMPSLSWQTVVIGDPLCAPFQREAVPSADLTPPIDADTELPSMFSARRIEAANIKSSDQKAIRLVLRADVRLVQQDLQGARDLLEQALALDGEMHEQWRVLATLYDQLGASDKSVPIYRRILERNPKDALALNNLAYVLGVRENRLEEAEPLAEKALMLAPKNAAIIDTVAWIRHLRGDDERAAPLAIAAAQVLTENAETQLHAAVILAATNRFEDAAKLLAAAERLDPAIRDRPEFVETRKKISK